MLLCLAALLFMNSVGNWARIQESCTFPFLRKGEETKECVWNEEEKYWWCSLASDFDMYKRWQVCPNTSTTVGGNDPGKRCHFPFYYDSKWHHTCIHTSSSGGYWWCSTTDDYSRDRQWTRCRPKSQELPCKFSFKDSAEGIDSECRPFQDKWVCQTEANEIRECPETDKTFGGNDPGKPCTFPFYYLMTEYQGCIHKRRKDQKVKDDIAWCATTSDYDNDLLWTKCKSSSNSPLSQTVITAIIVGCSILGLLLISCFFYYMSDSRSALRRYCFSDKDSLEEEDDMEFRRSLSNPRYSRPERSVSPTTRASSVECQTQEARLFPNWTSENLSNYAGSNNVTPTAPPPPYEKVIEESAVRLNPDDANKELSSDE